VWLQTKSEALCCGVTLPQCHAILEIGAAGELSLKELSARSGLDPSTLSRTVESLVREGLAERNPSAADRRATVIRLSPAGRTACESINTTWNGICREMFRRIPRRRHRQFVETAALLAELLGGCCAGQCADEGLSVRVRRERRIPGA
jgi:DNA-binding MarR family transcriptional regulator